MPPYPFQQLIDVDNVEQHHRMHQTAKQKLSLLMLCHRKTYFPPPTLICIIAIH